jgi:hypothetical protein
MDPLMVSTARYWVFCNTGWPGAESQRLVAERLAVYWTKNPKLFEGQESTATLFDVVIFKSVCARPMVIKVKRQKSRMPLILTMGEF